MTGPELRRRIDAEVRRRLLESVSTVRRLADPGPRAAVTAELVAWLLLCVLLAVTIARA